MASKIHNAKCVESNANIWEIPLFVKTHNAKYIETNALCIRKYIMHNAVYIQKCIMHNALLRSIMYFCIESALC